MQSYLAELRAEFRGPRALIVWAGLTSVLAAGGPLGTLENCTFEHRFLFWAIVVIAIVTLIATAQAAWTRFFGRAPGQRDLPLVAAAIAFGLTVPIRALAAGQGEMSVQIVSSRTTETLTFLFLTTLALAVFRQMHPTPAVPSEHRPADPDSLPRLIRRLEPEVQGTLLSLTGRDHYVDVRTSAGTGSILMRFSDAMAEAAPVDGGQIHRSHWVAWSAVEGVERDGGRITVIAGGQRLPVSRSFRAALAERGLL